MLIIRKNQTNNLVATVSMNKTLSNPYYLFSFQHITSKERVSFIPQVVVSNTRYDKFRFVETQTTNLSVTPPNVNFFYDGQYYYSIYEQLSSGNTDPSLAYNKLESGRAVVIVGEDQEQNCFFEPYVSQNEIMENVVFLSEIEEECNQPLTPSVTPSNTPTPSITPSVTPTPSITPSHTPSATPTLTPTPSSTPPSAIDPNTLNALWWIDYTDPNYVSLSSGNVLGVKNRTGNPDFSGKTGQNQGYDATGYNGVSGATRTGFGVFSLSGDYNTSISAYTYFFTFSATTGINGILVQSDLTTDYSGNSQSYRWFSSDDTNGGDVFRTYTFYSGGTSVSPEPDYMYTPGVWYKGAIRVFQSTNTAHTEFWINGSIVDATNQNGETIRTSTNPIFQIGGNGGPDFKISEAFFFDYKLDNGQMSTMFNYLNNKYV
jgi:hypothetical protein